MCLNFRRTRLPAVSVKKGGRKCCLDSMPKLEDNFIDVVAPYTAGDPMHEEIVWTHLTCEEISQELAGLGTPVSPDTVSVLLDEFDFVKRQAQRRLALGSYPQRDEQFRQIAQLKEEYLDSPNPILSIDTKKKEHLGNYFRPGRVYGTGPIPTLDHDFYKKGQIAIPHGVYDLKRNVGYLTLGTTHDTSEFICESLWYWWHQSLSRVYPQADSLLLLCDAGGSNSYRHYIFKQDLQGVAERMGIPIRVAHYPPYCSKYNPIEHRMFPHVTRACQGIIFHALETARHFMGRARTRTGFRVLARILDKPFALKRAVSDGFLEMFPIQFAKRLPDLNYTALSVIEGS